MAIWRPSPRIPVRHRVPPPILLALQFLAMGSTTNVSVNLGSDVPETYEVSSEVEETASTVVTATVSSSTAEGEVSQQQVIIESQGGGDTGKTTVAPGTRVDATVNVTGAGTDVGLQSSDVE